MPTPRVQVRLRGQPADTFLVQRTLLDAELQTKQVRDRVHDGILREDTSSEFVLHVRFRNVPDARAFWSFVQANTAILGTGRASYHLCSHLDPEIYDCQHDARAAHEEVSF